MINNSGNNANTVLHPPVAMMSLFRSYGYSVTICGSVKDFIRKCASQGKCLRSYLKNKKAERQKKRDEEVRKWQCRQKLEMKS
jgi:thiamine pyrophosphate-dependent acetolactate synthase large subunit-like protein